MAFLKNIKTSKIVLKEMDLLVVATGWQDAIHNDMDVVFGAENNKSISFNAIFETTFEQRQITLDNYNKSLTMPELNR
jgi:hypothetical protein